MEEECNDPYEQQLLAVFKSCLVDGDNELDEEGLLDLCAKLQLDDVSKNSIVRLLKRKSVRKSVCFNEFRDGFLALLGKSQEGSPSEKGLVVDSRTNPKMTNNAMSNQYSRCAQLERKEPANRPNLLTGTKSAFSLLLIGFTVKCTFRCTDSYETVIFRSNLRRQKTYEILERFEFSHYRRRK